MTTGLDLVTGALRLLSVVNKGEAISADEASDGLVRLNEYVESIANDGLLVYARTWENFPVSLNDGEYTIGASQDFNTTRPVQIHSAYIRIDGTDHPIDVIPDEQYAAISDKDTLGTPGYLNYDNAYPAAKVRLWPVPNQSGTLYLQTEKVVTSFTLSGDVSLPPGWARMLRYNLAVELGPEYGAAIPDVVMRGAADSMALIRTAVMKQRPISSQAGRGHYDIYSDTYV